MKLFTPAWKSENEEKAFRAVEKITDQALMTKLAKVAKKAKHWKVRKAAVEKLTDQTVLADIAKNDINWRVRKAAVEKLTERTALIDVARNSNYYDVSEKATMELIEPTVREVDMSPLYMNPDVKFLSMDELVDMAKNHKSWQMRKMLIRILDDQNLLDYVAKNDSEADVRMAAVKNKYFINQRALAFIAKNDRDSIVRKVAVEKLIDKNALSDIARNDSDADVRLAAVRNKHFTDHTELVIIAKNDINFHVVKAVVEKLLDCGFVDETEKNDSDSDVSKEATEEMEELESENDINQTEE
jgi:hypothetical protein